jgi:hypothetical protein
MTPPSRLNCPGYSWPGQFLMHTARRLPRMIHWCIDVRRRRLGSWPVRMRSWAQAREAEVDAIGRSPHWGLVLRVRVPFHVAMRAACRIWIAVDRRGQTNLRQIAVAACVAWDVLEAVRLQRDPRLRLGQRLVADLADVGGWSRVADKAYAGVPIIGVPLITETALRYQWAGAPLVVAHLLAVGASRRLAHKPLEPVNLGYPVLALLFGLGLRRVEQTGADRVRARFEVERKAAETTAAIAGQYRVARSSYLVRGESLNPHDVLSGIRLHFPSARNQRSSLYELTWGSRKSALESLVVERAVQLDTALRAYKRDTNLHRSALAHQVLDPTLPEGHGMTLLSGYQVGHLGRALDALNVRGEFAVRVLEAPRPGARLVLSVNGAGVVVPPDLPRLEVVRADPTPVAMLQCGVLYALLEGTEAADAAPMWSVIPGAAAFATIAAWSSSALRKRGDAAHESMIMLSGFAALAQALAVHLAIRGEPDRPDGSQRLPMQIALSAPTVLAGLCSTSLDPGARRRTMVMFAALAMIGLALLEPPRWRLDLIRNAVWLPALFVPARAYSAGSEKYVQEVRVELHARQVQAADDAARRGEYSEWERVLAACNEGLACLDSVSPSARPAIERRLRDLQSLAEEHLDAYY